MEEKRYAIVRVDKLKFCPSDIEGIDDKLVCSKTKDGESKVCVCRYGDTKEQLIKKIAQVIRRYRKNLEVCDYCDMKDEFEIAEKVVEFLGVE